MIKLVASIFILLGLLILALPVQASSRHKAVCPTKRANFRCNAEVVTDDGVNPHSAGMPEGYGPAQFLGAYHLSGKSSGQAVAVVDAYDDPNIFSDVNTYSKVFGITQMKSCQVSSEATDCFQKIDQRGSSKFPSADSGWAMEIALDVETIHALCQSCNILLVEADSASFSNLMDAFDRAVSSVVKVISNSYGGSEFLTEKNYDSHFNHPGLAMTFSAGDSGYGVEYPAASKYVTAVGGTTLNLRGNSYGSESVWSDSGSGCSKYEEKPGWQKDSKCAKRIVADVSADADPDTGAAVYDSFSYSGKIGWFKLGGTSLASPIIASVYALAGRIPSGVWANALPYNESDHLRDII
jgi:subtilase family serine protease